MSYLSIEEKENCKLQINSRYNILLNHKKYSKVLKPLFLKDPESLQTLKFPASIVKLNAEILRCHHSITF